MSELDDILDGISFYSSTCINLLIFDQSNCSKRTVKPNKTFCVKYNPISFLFVLRAINPIAKMIDSTQFDLKIYE